jgi:hypothetical protein
MRMLHSFGRGLVAAALAIAVATPAAQAARTTGGACPTRAFTPAFSAWGDQALYTLAPGGDFESGAAGWTLAGSAVVVAGSSGFGQGASSLSLPVGAWALSPPFCVEKNYPSWRLAARSGGGKLAVDVVYPKTTKQTARLMPSAGWALSPVLKYSTGRFQGGAFIQVRFTASGKPVHIDDVYIDPRMWR